MKLKSDTSISKIVARLEASQTKPITTKNAPTLMLASFISTAPLAKPLQSKQNRQIITTYSVQYLHASQLWNSYGIEDVEVGLQQHAKKEPIIKRGKS